MTYSTLPPVSREGFANRLESMGGGSRDHEIRCRLLQAASVILRRPWKVLRCIVSRVIIWHDGDV